MRNRERTMKAEMDFRKILKYGLTLRKVKILVLFKSKI